ncbi:N-acyl-D-amino-acid deacylase family protein [Paludisphaera soli]|uniref:N-acyl-D-amino-acid deacylase family protein n=1 Tax=Paludisphaera soli TaxID=2712865 RepID=UPI0013ED4B99|nr:D-aminoacylase [Paludisphaera soli]
MPRHPRVATVLLLLAGLVGGRPAIGQEYDVILRGGTVYDGSGGPAVAADVAVSGDRIAAVGDLHGARAGREIDARGLAVAPGFINMLSWAPSSLLVDGRSQGDVRQGVTLEVFGEGESCGPYTPALKAEAVRQQRDLRFDITWDTLGGFLETLERRGVSCNVASFVGAATVRSCVVGLDDRDPTVEELERMRVLVDQAMSEGALGVGSALIYAPGSYAKTDELVALCEVAARRGGMYISHIRSEGDRLLEAVDELIAIARRANIPAEIYHLKAAGRANWPKLDEALAKVEAARADGLKITADVYPYTAGATGLDAAMPTWVQAGGLDAWIARLKDPATRTRVVREIAEPGADWESLYKAAGSADRVLLAGFKSDRLKPLTGKTLAEVAAVRGASPEETIVDLVVEDGSRVDAIYFFIDEENLRKELRKPWVSVCSDEGSFAPEGVFLRSNPHPRAYGSFARVLGRYVRDQRILPMEEAVRRLTSLPAENLKLDRRGRLAEGFFADVVAFDPTAIADLATYEAPHQYAVGVRTVLVNGAIVVDGGEHTGAKPGRALRGPGWKRD